MKTKTPILMLGIGLAVGIMVGYSLKDSVPAGEQMRMDELTLISKNIRLIPLRSSGADSQVQKGELIFQVGPSRMPSKPVSPAKTPAQFDPLAPVMNPSLDLIDMRYEAPQLD